jgi:hypothetical protein
MEAVAAVGIAAAAAQFLDFSVKTLTLCKEIRDSSSGSTKTNDKLTKSIKKLTAMQKDLQQYGSTPSSTYRQLIRAVQDCSVVASELLKLLEDIREVAKKSLGTMRSALKAIKERKSIEKLQARLADCQDKYHIALTTDMRDEVLRLLEKQGKDTDSMRDIILQRLDKASAESAASHSTTHGKLHTLGEDLNRSTSTVQKELSALRISQQSSSKRLQTGQRSLGKNLDGQFQRLSTSDTLQKFLDMLYFPEMFARQESMKKRSPGTYDWVFSSELPKSNDRDKELRGRISCWLRNTDKSNLFWISGKPGSGKSSLVSFIMGDRRTKECMRSWAGGRDPYIFSFFFWKPGSSLQKTMLGLRRSLLWQLCKAKPTIIEKLLSQDSTLLYSPCTDDKLTIALDLALAQYQDESVLFLIDGLDECEGNHNDLLDELHGTRFGQWKKTCLSSRPEEALRRRLETLPSVRLQDLNYEDILEYAHKKLQIGGNPELKLASRVAENSEGVFLWAVLVCDSLSLGVMAKDDGKTMLRRLHAYPRGLDDLFNRMFSDIEEVHHKSMALYFYAARQSSFSVATAVASQHPRKPMRIVEFGGLCEREMTRITTQSRGLLQIVERNVNYDWTLGWSFRNTSDGQIRKSPLERSDLQVFKKYLSTDITYVHRSAYDYIFNDTDDKRPQWLHSIGGPEMIHHILRGIVWIAQYSPIIIMKLERSPTPDNGYQPECRVFNLSDHFRAIATADLPKLDRKHFHGWLDTHFDTIHNWMSAQDRDQTVSFLDDQVPHPPMARQLLKGFWVSIMRVDPNYVTSRPNLLLDSDDAYFMTLSLFRSSEWSMPYLLERRLEADHALHSVLAAARLRGLQQGRGDSSLADHLYAAGQKNYNLRRYEPGLGGLGDLLHFYTWLGTGNKDELSITEELFHIADCIQFRSHSDKTTGRQPSGPHALLAFGIFTALYAIFDAWKYFEGTIVGARNDDKILSPLQLSLPFYYVYLPQLYCHIEDQAMLNELSSCAPNLTLRLSCFAKHGPGSLGEQQVKRAPATATYHLSPATTKIVIAHSMHENGRRTSRLAGTAANRSKCMEMILTDLWDDVESQLTAWEQLYTRACVKRYFAWCWKVTDQTPNEQDFNLGSRWDLRFRGKSKKNIGVAGM